MVPEPESISMEIGTCAAPSDSTADVAKRSGASGPTSIAFTGG